MQTLVKDSGVENPNRRQQESQNVASRQQNFTD